MSKQKLLFANIKIPIQVLSDGSIQPFQDNIDIEFTECESLPEAKNNEDVSYLMKKLMNYMDKDKQIIHSHIVSETEPETEIESDTYADNEPEPEAKIMILKEDIKTTHTRPVNSSFKKRQFKHRHTTKCHTTKCHTANHN